MDKNTPCGYNVEFSVSSNFSYITEPMVCKGLLTCEHVCLHACVRTWWFVNVIVITLIYCAKFRWTRRNIYIERKYLHWTEIPALNGNICIERKYVWSHNFTFEFRCGQNLLYLLSLNLVIRSFLRYACRMSQTYGYQLPFMIFILRLFFCVTNECSVQPEALASVGPL